MGNLWVAICRPNGGRGRTGPHEDITVIVLVLLLAAMVLVPLLLISIV